MIKWIREHLTWPRDVPKLPAGDLELLNRISEELTDTVNETRDISSRIISKLEDRVAFAEAKLSDREQLLGVVFDTIPDFLCLKDPDGRWKLLNKYGKRLYSLNRGNEYKEHTDDEIAQLSPRYARSLKQCVDTDNLAWERREPINVEERFKDSFGTEYVFDVTKTPVFDEDGERKYLLVHGVNISEYVNNTRHIEMLITALNHASDSIAVTDESHIIVYANDAFCRNHGYELKEVLGRPMNFIGTDMTPDEVKKDLNDTISKGKSWTGIVVNQKKDGTPIQESITISPVLNGKPYPIYYILVKRPYKPQ